MVAFLDNIHSLFSHLFTSFHLTVPDPCLSATCDIHALCESSFNSSSFTCSCLPPFSHGDGFSCSSNWLLAW